MQKALVIDSMSGNRASLIYQLGQIGQYQFLQANNYSEADAIFNSPIYFRGLVFISAEGDDFKALVQFLESVRARNQDACVIVMAPALTLDQIRSLIQVGIDQIVIRPVNVIKLRDKIHEAQTFRKQVIEEKKLGFGKTGLDSVIENLSPNYYRVTLMGWLSEKAVLPQVKPEASEATIFIDCEHLRGISSIGIRLCILWLRSLKDLGFQKFEFDNLRGPILNQAGMIQGFLPESGSVNSFYATYRELTQDTERDFRICRGKDFTDEKMILFSKREELKDGTKTTYELDMPARKALRFFKGQIVIIE